MKISQVKPCTLLFCASGREPQWREAFQRCAPQVTFRSWPDWDPAERAEFALVWRPPAGELARHRSLQGIFSIGAGIDHLASDPALPLGVPVIRMVDPTLTSGMSEFVVMSTLYHHRRMTTYAVQQRDRIWQAHDVISANRRSVGVMGVGVLGLDVLKKLGGFDFELRAWSRTPKQIEGVTHYAGPEQMSTFLQGLDIVICLLPLTAASRGILNRQAFSHLADGAIVINVGRGEHMIEDDFVDCYQSGKLGGATLDVFEQEPLPRNHALWGMSGVVVTPHIASQTSPHSAVPAVIEQIKRYQSGQSFTHVVDKARGY